MLPEIRPVTDWLVPATARLLKPVTNELNATSFATSSWYPVDPPTAVQFAVKLVVVISVAAVAVGVPGAVGSVVSEMTFELSPVRVPFVPRMR